jgi:hypothetical protein
MPKYLLIAINGPTSGEGAKSVRRFKIVAQNRIDKPYVNVTEFEADSTEALMKELAEKASDFTDKIDRTTSVFVLGREITKDAK